MVTDGEVQVPDVNLTSAVYHESAVASAVPPNQHIPAWTMDTSLPGDQNHRDAGKSEVSESV